MPGFMKNVLIYIGSAVYGLVASYLLWLFFDWFCPFYIRYGTIFFWWFWLVTSGILIPLYATLASLLMTPLVMMTSKRKKAVRLPALFLLVFGFSTVMLPWHMELRALANDLSVGFWKPIIYGIVFDIDTAFLFLAAISTLFRNQNEED